jgi:perosamine synthetase
MKTILPPALLAAGEPKKLFDARRYSLWPILDEDCKRAVSSVLERGVLSGNFGPAALAFQEAFAEFVGAKYAVLSHSGTSALVLALSAAGVGQGDEVIVPSYTFVATPQSVLATGATPVFADVDPVSGNILPGEVERWITPATKAVLAVHVHGCPADLGALRAICQAKKIELLEDAAQAHGALYEGQPVGALCGGGAFSLQSSKNLGAGEGGVYVTNDFARAEIANQVRNFGHDLSLAEAPQNDLRRPLDGWRSLDSRRIGSMYRGNEMMAALALALLKKLPERTRSCQENAARLSQRLAKLPGVLPPVIPRDRTSVFHKYRVHFDLASADLADYEPTQVRDAILGALKQTGFEATLWERHPQTHHTIFREAKSVAPHIRENYHAPFPNTEKLLGSSLLLFTQSCPLIAQNAETVEAYGEAFETLWSERKAIVQAALGK